MARLLTTAKQDPRLPNEDRYHLAIARLKAADHAGYRAACAEIAERVPPAGTPIHLDDALLATWAFRIGPSAADKWSTPFSWGERILAKLAEREAADPSRKERNTKMRLLFQHLRGALLVRSGRPEEAVAELRAPAALHALDNEFANCVFLALAEHRLGHANATKAAATKARAAQARFKPDSAWDRAEVELLAAELDAVLSPAGK